MVLSDHAELTAVFVEDGTATSTGVQTRLPDGLLQNHPNPFSSTTVVEFVTGLPGNVRIELFDVLGRRVTELTDGYRAAGRHSAVLDAHTLNSGVYFYTLTTARSSITRTLTVVR